MCSDIVEVVSGLVGITIVIVVFGILLSNCGTYEPPPPDPAIEMCVEKGGIPLRDSFNKLKECVFPPQQE